jgi:hypothetical protein
MAATGGAGTGGRVISVARGFTGFEGEAQTQLLRALFGDSVKGLTARNVYETSTPTTQCRRVIGEPSSCWICGVSFAPRFTAHLGGPQCEHILPIVQAIMYLGLYSHEHYKSLSPSEKATYLDHLRLEYGWAHAKCNYLKKAAVYIGYNPGTGRYEVTADKIKGLLNNILTLFPFNKLKPDEKAYFRTSQLTMITTRIFEPITDILNTRWVDDTGKGIPAQGLDQLSAVVALLSAPKTAAGAAATADANLGGGAVGRTLLLPKDAEDLYAGILRRTTNIRLTDSIKRELRENTDLQREILALFRKIPFVAKSTADMNAYIQAVGDYAIYWASSLKATTASGRAIMHPVSFGSAPTYDEARIKVLRDVSIIDTLTAGNVDPLDVLAEEDVPFENSASSNLNTTVTSLGGFVIGEEDEEMQREMALSEIASAKAIQRLTLESQLQPILDERRKQMSQAFKRRKTIFGPRKRGGMRATRKKRRTL